MKYSKIGIFGTCKTFKVKKIHFMGKNVNKVIYFHKKEVPKIHVKLIKVYFTFFLNESFKNSYTATA